MTRGNNTTYSGVCVCGWEFSFRDRVYKAATTFDKNAKETALRNVSWCKPKKQNFKLEIMKKCTLPKLPNVYDPPSTSSGA